MSNGISMIHKLQRAAIDYIKWNKFQEFESGNVASSSHLCDMIG